MDSSFQITFNQSADVITNIVTITADQKVFSGGTGDGITVPASTPTDYVIAIDPDALKGYAIVSDVDITLTTTNNPAGTPDVINLVAGEPVAWHNKMQLTKHFANAGPWTKWTFSANTAEALVQVLIMTDATP